MQPDQAGNIVLDTEVPPPTFGTLPGIASINSVYADHNCGEEDGTHYRKLKGEALDGTEGWGDGEDGKAWPTEFYQLAEDVA